jgi:predicted protein tyrosine phosphatase
MTRVLFVCSQNKLRSPTAEHVFAGRAGFEVTSAGTDKNAETPVSPEHIEWADIIFVMQRSHRSRLAKNFRAQLKDKRVVCLDIPDDYEYMDPELVRLLTMKAGPYFDRRATPPNTSFERTREG